MKIYSKTPFLVILFVLILSGSNAYAYEIRSGTLSLTSYGSKSKGYYLELKNDGVLKEFINHPNPVTLEINENTLTSFYNAISLKKDTMICSSKVRTPNGSIFLVEDKYFSEQTGFIKLVRSIKINSSDTRDKFFNSYFGFFFSKKNDLSNYEFFVPGIWYKDNKYLTKRALASDYNDTYFYFREDRIPLPLISIKEKEKDESLMLIHSDSYPQTFYGEDGINRIVDERMQFGSLGFSKYDGVSLQFVFPGIEGEKSYTGYLNDNSFSYRNHPVDKNTVHNYSLVFGSQQTSTFPQMVESSWKKAWSIYSPKVYDVEVDKAYRYSIEVLDEYLRNINGAPGWPFSIYLPNGTARAYNYQMGFIGAQIQNAYFLLRDGLLNKNPEYVRRASEVIDFWVKESPTATGLPKTWVDAYVDREHTWRTYETYMRSTESGMEGLLSAWSMMKKYSRERPEWFEYAKKYADWLVENQESDGSFYIRYHWEDSKPNHDSKYTTTNVIRFLVEMYLITSDKKYYTAALNAGEFSYDFIHNDYLYVGGVIDNPNVKDRESGQMAIYAFLALYDATKDDKWKEAAIQAARYTETFMFSYDVPMALNDTLTDFPTHRNIIGMTLIATGHSGIDNGLSFSSFHYYRLFLMTGDPHFLQVAKIIQKNTLQIMDVNGELGYKFKGLLTECFGPQSNRGHSVRQQLPWNQAAVLDPLIRFRDVFGQYDIDEIEKIPISRRLELLNNYSANQGMNTLKK